MAVPYFRPPVQVQAWDLNANQFLTELKAINPTFSKRLGDPGAVSFALDLTDPEQKAQTAIVRDYDGVPFKVLFVDPSSMKVLHSAICWSDTLSKTSPTIPYHGRGLMSFWNTVPIAKSYKTSISPAQLINDVIVDAQKVLGQNLWMTPVPALLSAPPNITPSYDVDSYTMVSQVVADSVAGVAPGTGSVDYWENDFIDSRGVLQHQLIINAPRSGRDASSSQLWMDPLRGTDWSWPQDASRMVNNAIAVGAGSGSVSPRATAKSAYPVGGLGQPPLMTGVFQFSRVSDPGQLANLAAGQIRVFQKPVTTPVVTLPIDYPPMPLGSFIVGDDVQVFSGPSNWFPHGLHGWWRIAGLEVKYPTDGSGVSTMTITLNTPPAF